MGGAPGAELFAKQRLHIPGENAARCELVAIAHFGEEGFAPEPGGCALDGFLERQVLECVQRIVVNEDADRPLRRQQMRESIDDARERMVRRARLAFP